MHTWLHDYHTIGFLCFRGFPFLGMLRVVNVEDHAAQTVVGLQAK